MPLKWDSFSDQPEIIKDKALKEKIRKGARWASFKMKLTSLLVYPVALTLSFLIPKKKTDISTFEFFGIGINLDKNPQDTLQLIDDLSPENLLIRLPLHDIENLQTYVDFAKQFKDKKILINVLQDRRHIQDLQLLRTSLDKIFQAFEPICNSFQIGNAINRKKWAFFSMDEYLSFYKIAYELKKSKYPDFILLGSSVIDFEYYFTIRTLFNGYKIYFDKCSSLLYVDRRGAPENTQMGLDLRKKLHFLYTLLRFSSKSGTDIVITETNWPIQNTAPYAPTGEKECVNLEDHANYLVRYYLLALASGVVSSVYWHQLIAPGYGLIDNRDGKLEKYPAYYAFKTMLSLLKGAKFIELFVTGDLYQASFLDSSSAKKIDVYWALSPQMIDAEDRNVVLRDGEKAEQTEEIHVNESPLYLIKK